MVAADPINRLLDLLPDHRKAGNGWSAKCPAHEDRRASLSLTSGDDGRALLKCHSGCTAADIVKSLGLKLSDLYVNQDRNGFNGHRNGHPNPKSEKPRATIETIYLYVDPDTGETLYEKVRYRPKDFRQRRPDGKGGWVYSLGDVKRVLYRLPELNEAGFSETVFLCNGEKAVEALRNAGLLATCTCDGEAKWRDEYTDQLRQRHVAVLVDNDDTGRKHGEKVSAAIVNAAASVRVVALPGLPAKGDVYDFLESGRTVQDLIDTTNATPAYKPGPITSFQTVRELMRLNPELRPAVIRGLIRRGETMNVISSPKMGKSWLVLCLAICVATGRMWLGTFETVQGDVLIIDNELHGETTANRIPRVADAMGMGVDEFCDHLFVENVRGRLRSIFDMESYFAEIEPGRFKIIILDAFYRFLPAGSDENDNSTMANVYNLLNRVADRLGCCFVLIHHTSKGNQSAKDITSVGSGAGSQSRATDTHLILRLHEEDGVVVLDAAVRSWAPVDPMCLRWAFPLFNRADDLDPTQLRKENYRKRRDEKPVEAAAPKVEWTTATFVQRFINNEPRTESQILVDAQSDLSERKAKRFLDVAIESGSVHRWAYADRNKAHRFSTIPQPVVETGNGVQK